MTFVVLDIETTGLSRYSNKITEIAAVIVKDGKIHDEFHTLVNPEVRIPGFITKLTGIDNAMVKDAPKIRSVMPEFVKFLGDHIIVAHNASFDYGFLDENAVSSIGKGLTNEVLCTRKLANRLVPDLPSKKLSCLCEHFGVSNQQAHRAKGDVYATVEIFNNFLMMLKQKEITAPEEILRFQDMQRSKIN
jgi:DNA polymerase III epsilon subunit family exonuclease